MTNNSSVHSIITLSACWGQPLQTRASNSQTKAFSTRFSTMKPLLGAVFLTLCFMLHQSQAEATEPCPTDFSCDKQCDHGLKTDVNGCPKCQCMQLLCTEVDCAAGHVCEVFTLTSSNSDIARCVDPRKPSLCQQPMDAGTCRAMKVKWYYDSETDQCQEFLYGGCKGNDNRFDTHEKCQAGCVSPSGCPLVMCAMYCEHGFVKNEDGCDICKCKLAPDVATENKKLYPDFEVDAGCDGDNNMMCGMHCEHGFRRDRDGCEICDCNPPPDCPHIQCDLECDHGLVRDGHDCEECACRKEGECRDTQCLMFCEYGFERDRFDCQRCACRENPCALTDCPDRTVCKTTHNNVTDNHIAKCVMADSWNGMCPEVMCNMMCENGFVTDKKGCDICKCRTQPPTECALMKCEPCNYGYAYDEMGCRTCECLDNPCHELGCETEEKVCEVMKECFGGDCRFSARCLGKSNVRRVHVQLKYLHQPLDEMDTEEFIMELKIKMAEMLGIDVAEIHKIMVERPDSLTVNVDFHIVAETEPDLVGVLDRFRAKVTYHSEGSSFQYAGTDFIPEKDSLVASYSSNPIVPYDSGASTDGSGSATLIIVIACIVGGILVAAIVAGVLFNMTKNKQKPKERKNIIYKPAAKDGSYA